MSEGKHKDFQVGQVYKMKVAKESHVKRPYYVIVSEVGDDHITTKIPFEHSLKITKGLSWDYHIPRMKLMGSGIKERRLLYFQKGLVR